MGQLEHKKLDFVCLKQGDLCLRVGRESRLYGLKSVDASALGSVKLVQSGNDFYSMSAWPGHGEGERPSVAAAGTKIYTNTDAAVVEVLENTDMGSIGCNVFPDRPLQSGLRAVRLDGEGDTICFGYVRRTDGSLSQEAAAFIQYLKEELADGMEEGGNKGREKQ